MHLMLWLALLPIAHLGLQLGVSEASDVDPSLGLFGHGQFVPKEEDGGCGTLLLNSDETYEGAFAWRYDGIAPPEYGAFAECFDGEGYACAAVFDLTQAGDQQGRTMNVYVWASEGGLPSSVLCVEPDVDPGQVAAWPAISRHVVEFSNPCTVGSSWWVGYWGNWQGEREGWFVAADLSALGGGCPITRIAPGQGYPTGWHDVSIVWGPTNALGIGAEVVTPTPVRPSSWGGIKQLYR